MITTTQERRTRTKQNILDKLNEVMQAARELAESAQQIGIILTIETVPTQPPRMGEYDLKVEARMGRTLYQMVAEIDHEADMAEMDCANGFHSWTAEKDMLPAGTPCAHCGEPYGDPT